VLSLIGGVKLWASPESSSPLNQTFLLYQGDLVMSSEFTRQDLDVLFEAVEAWEREDKGPGLMGALLTGMVGESASDEGKSQMERSMEQKQKEADHERKMRKERGVLLRAKLITLRDKADAASFAESVPAS